MKRSTAGELTPDPGTQPDSLHSVASDTESECLTLDEAISLLESEAATDRLKVDLGTGETVWLVCDDGLLQRLSGHRDISGLTDMACKKADNCNLPVGEPVWVAPVVNDMFKVLSKT